MAENKLVGSLVLRTIDIAPTRNAPVAVAGTNYDDDPFGICTANGGVITWRNVNIRTCLGELYKKYDRFNLKLTAAQMRHNTGAAITDAQFLIYLSGLPFSSGSTYSTRFGPTNQSCLGAVNFVSSVSEGNTTSLLSGLVSFDKPLQDILNITVELRNSSTLTTNPLVNGFSEKPTMPLGHWSIVYRTCMWLT